MYKFTQLFVATAVDGSAATHALTVGEIAAFTPDLSTNLGLAAAITTPPTEFKLVMGSGSTKYGSFKTPTIKSKNILSVVKTNADNTTTQQVTHIGYTGSAGTTPTFSCDQEYVVSVRIEENYLSNVFHDRVMRSVVIKTACCDTCSGGCDDLDAETYMDAIVAGINADPILTKYVVAAKVGSGANWGVSITGKALDAFGNECQPDAVAEMFNLVRFKVYVHPGPYTTQDDDMEDSCANWDITYTTAVKYPLGWGAAMAEMERNLFLNNLPTDIRRYWDLTHNNEADEFLFVDKTKVYETYEITFLEDSHGGNQNKSQNTHSILIFSEEGGSGEAAIRDLINALTGESFTD